MLELTERKKSTWILRTTFIAEDWMHWYSYLMLAVDGSLSNLLWEQWQPLESQESMKKKEFGDYQYQLKKSSAELEAIYRKAMI